MAYLVDRCLWATPSPLLSIIKALLPAQARLLKPFKLKAVFPPVVSFFPSGADEICYKALVSHLQFAFHHLLKFVLSH